MNLKALPPIYDKPLPTKKVASGIWVVTSDAEVSEEQAAKDYYRSSGLFSKPLVKRQKANPEK